MISTLVPLLVVAVVLGLVLWLIQYLPIAQPFKNVAVAVFCVIAIVYVVTRFL